MNYQKLIEKIAKHVETYFDEHPRPDLLYHNFSHTASVVKAAEEIAEHYHLSDEDEFVLIAAAWFHDTGYLLQAQAHEERSTDVTRKYLKKQEVPDATINRINATIMATCMPQHPVTLLEQIICDADLYHLSTDNFKKKSNRLRKEFEALQHQDIDKKTWWPGTLAFMERHQYATSYGRNVLEPRKAANIEQLKSDMRAEQTEAQLPDIIPQEGEDTSGQNPKKKDRPEKGIETMFRITSSNNQRLSDMADKKAQILITVNSIILSALISLVLRKLDENNYLIVPTAMLLMISLTSMIFSILATRPTIPDGLFSQQDLDDKKVNLLFFGNFYRMNIEQYTHGMKMVMEDREFLYGTLIKDVYSQGAVLGKKYHLLRWAYDIFMYGLIASVSAFIIASLIHNFGGGKN